MNLSFERLYQTAYDKAQRLEKENNKLQAQLKIAREAFQKLADEDYRGNRPNSAMVAEKVLKEIDNVK